MVEDSGARTITQAELLANASDVEGNSLVANSLVITAGSGSLVDNFDGTWDYTPALNDDTSVSFGYSITDGPSTIAGTATLDLLPSNDPPTISVTPENPGFTGSAVGLFSSTSIDLIEGSQNVQSIAMQIAGLLDGAAERLVVNSSSLALTTGVTNLADVTVSISLSGSTATVTFSGFVDVTAAENLIDGLQYINTNTTPSTGTRAATINGIQDNGGGADSFNPNITSTVSINVTNTSPTLTATGASAVFVEGSSPISLFSGTTIDLGDAGDLIQTIELQVSGLTDGIHENLVIDGESIVLVNGTSVTTSANGYIVGISGTATKNVVISRTGNFSAAEGENLIDSLRYQNSSEDPANGSTKTIVITEIQDDGGAGNASAALSVSATATVSAVNDAPSVVATASSSGFTEDEAAVAIFSGTGIDLVESSDLVDNIQLSVTGISDGADETLTVNSVSIPLQAGTTTVGGLTVEMVNVAGGVQVQISHVMGISRNDAQGLINNLRYSHSSQSPTEGNRLFTLVSLQDTGGGTDTATLGITSSIAVSAQNDAPTIGNASLSPVDQGATDPNGQTVTDLFGGSFGDVDAGSSLAGVVIVGNDTTVASTQGVWQYSNDGSTWHDVGTVNDSGLGLVISESALIRFLPVTTFSGTPANLVVRGLDNSYAGSFSSATRYVVDTSSPVSTSSFSTATSIVSTSINAMNTRPQIGDAFLSAIAEDDDSATGDTVLNLFGPSFVDADSGSSLAGIVVVGNQADAATEGVWQYQSDGSTWSAVGSVSTANGLMISESSRIRFVPVADFNGSPTRLVVMGMDNTYTGPYSDSGGAKVFRNAVAGAMIPGSPLSTNAGRLTTFVTSVNDAPTLNPLVREVIAGNSLLSRAIVFRAIANDVDGDVLEAQLINGPNNGTLTLQSNGRFVYTPNEGFTGTDAFTWLADDGTEVSNPRLVVINVLPAIAPPPTEETETSPPEESTEESEDSSLNNSDVGSSDNDDDEEEAIVSVDDEIDSSSKTSEVDRSNRSSELLGLVAKTNEESVLSGSTFVFGHLDAGSSQLQSNSVGKSIRQHIRTDRHLDSTFDSLRQVDFALMSGAGDYWDKLDESRTVDTSLPEHVLSARSIGAAASAATVAYIAWAVRGGILLSGLAMQMPAWQAIDPLMLVQGLSGKQETLEEMMERRRKQLSENKNPAQ